MSDYKINTATIFWALKGAYHSPADYKRFDLDFLSNEFYNILRYNLEEKKVPASVPFSDETRKYLEEYRDKRYDFALALSYKDGHFPFPDYFLRARLYNNERVHEIVEFSISNIIEKEEEDFVLFFAYQLALTDIMEVDAFLDFHLKESFKNDYIEFEDLLAKIMSKYKELLKDKHSPIIVRFLEKRNQSTKDINSNKEGINEFSTARQVLAIQYLLYAVNDKLYGSTDRTEVARFIQFLTNKEIGVKGITNTTIYKRVKSPFTHKEEALLKDLQYVREIFEKLGLQSIVNQINDENKMKNV